MEQRKHMENCGVAAFDLHCVVARSDRMGAPRTHPDRIIRCPECGTELSAERPRPERRAVLPTILVAFLTLGCIALLFIVAVFLAFAESAEC